MAGAINKATFPGNYSSLVKIAEFVRNASEEAGFDGETSYQIELAVDEAVTNIIEHAYGGEGVGEIDLAYCVDEKGLTIDLRDHGRPFNPNGVKNPKIDAPLEDRDNHGLGIFLIRKLMDEVHFSSEERRGNRLTLVKYKGEGM